jgi:hypothetical protein
MMGLAERAGADPPRTNSQARSMANVSSLPE